MTQDADSGEVLMVAWGDDESVRRSQETGWMYYWSRSRKSLWRKGEESGNTQKVVSLTWDCDHDALLAEVRPSGPTCHTGSRTCFGEPPRQAAVITELWDVLRELERTSPPDSYAAMLLAKPEVVREKIVEEAVELVLSSKGDGRDRVVHEAADLLFHVLVLLYLNGVPYADVLDEATEAAAMTAKRAEFHSHTVLTDGELLGNRAHPASGGFGALGHCR